MEGLGRSRFLEKSGVPGVPGFPSAVLPRRPLSCGRRRGRVPLAGPVTALMLGALAACPPRLPAPGSTRVHFRQRNIYRGASPMAEVLFQQTQAGRGREGWRLSRGKTGIRSSWPLCTHLGPCYKGAEESLERLLPRCGGLWSVAQTPPCTGLAHRAWTTGHGPGLHSSARSRTQPPGVGPTSLRDWAAGPHVWPRLCSRLSEGPGA